MLLSFCAFVQTVLSRGDQLSALHLCGTAVRIVVYFSFVWFFDGSCANFLVLSQVNRLRQALQEQLFSKQKQDDIMTIQSQMAVVAAANKRRRMGDDIGARCVLSVFNMQFYSFIIQYNPS